MQRVTLLFAVVMLLTSACSGGDAAAPATPSAGASLPGSVTATPGSAAVPTRTARISELRNIVSARLTSAADWLTAQEGEQINAGGGVRTGAESRVRIDTSDQSLIRIGANTEFQLLEFSPQPMNPVTRLQLDAGKLWVQVTQALGGGSFEVETPAGVAAVRGSLMSVAFDRATGQLAVTCLEGECELRDRAQNAVRLLAGEASEIVGLGQAPLAARRINRAELQDWIDNFPEAAAIARRLLERLGPDETPTPAPPGGLTACDHPYWPLRAGATWTYATGEGPVTWTIESVSGDASQAAAVMTFTIGEVTGTYNWQCDAGGIVSYDFGQVSFPELGRRTSINVIRSSGVWLPPANMLTVGFAWSLTYDLEMRLELPAAAGGGEGIALASVQEDNTVISANAITFGGQMFDGLQLSRQRSQTITITTLGMQLPPMQSAQAGTWELARGIGNVRWTYTTSGVLTTAELVSYSIP